MSATATNPALLTLSDSQVLFFPVPTPWPLLPGCGENIWRFDAEGDFVAWYPPYADLEHSALSCFPTQQRLWWSQPPYLGNPSTALGPTFVCPEAYSAVHTTEIGSGDSAAHTQFTYCCPSNYALNAERSYAPSDRFAAQCTSAADPGATISYRTAISSTTVVTLTGDNGSATVITRTESTGTPTSTVVQSPAVTVFAAPVNGYNIGQQQVVSDLETHSTDVTGTTTTSTPPPAAATSAAATQSSEPGQGLSPGAIAGVVVGAVAGVALLVLAIGIVFIRRRRRRQTQHLDDDRPDKLELANDEIAQELEVSPCEMPGKELPHELPHREVVHELSGEKH